MLAIFESYLLRCSAQRSDSVHVSGCSPPSLTWRDSAQALSHENTQPRLLTEVGCSQALRALAVLLGPADRPGLYSNYEDALIPIAITTGCWAIADQLARMLRPKVHGNPAMVTGPKLQADELERHAHRLGKHRTINKN